MQGTCTCSTAKPCSFEAERSNHHFKDKAFSPPFVPLFTARVFTMIPLIYFFFHDTFICTILGFENIDLSILTYLYNFLIVFVLRRIGNFPAM